MIKTVVLASNRTGVLEEIRKNSFLRLQHVFAVKDSALERGIEGVPHSLIRPGGKSEFLDELAGMEFDLFVSNGCPVIVPVSKLIKSHQLFINVHPSLLPEFRGYHPANGVLLKGAKEAGATLHEMVDRVDRGVVIHQERFPITPDLDLGLLYHLLFRTEARAFSGGIQKIFENGFKYGGEPQGEGVSYYRRTPEDMRVDFEVMDDAEILRRIRAFGISSQGARCNLGGRSYNLFEAQALINPLLNALYLDHAPGSIVLKYEDALVVRSRQSLIRVSKFSQV